MIASTRQRRRRSTLLEGLESRQLLAVLLIGGIVSGQISAMGEVDTYTFSAEAGETFLISNAVLDIDTNFIGRFQLTDPSSATLETFTENTSRRSFTVQTTGTVTLSVYDSGMDERGNYTVGVERVSGSSDDALPLEPGKLVTGQISSPVQTDQRYFDVAAGDSYFVSFHVGDIDSQFIGRLGLFDENGALLYTINENTSERIDFTAAARITVHIYDSGTDERGDYQFSVTSLKPDFNDTQIIATSQTVYGTIDGPDEVDQFVMPLAAGQSIGLVFATVDTDAPFIGRVYIYNPSTGLVDTINENTEGGFTAGAAGDYVLLVLDSGTNDRGEYGLAVNGLSDVKAYRNVLYVSGNADANQITIAPDDNEYVVTVDAEETRVNRSAVTSLDIRGFDGNDRVDYGAVSITSFVQGGTGNDYIQGGAGRDTITGGGGKNTIYGGDGEDRLSGSSSRDYLSGQAGNDRLYGNSGNDTLEGGGGVDRIYGGADDDLLIGGSSNDKMYGEAGNDILIGAAGNDFMSGGDGEDEGRRLGNDILNTIESIIG